MSENCNYEFFSMLNLTWQHDLQSYLERSDKLHPNNADFVEMYCLEFLSPLLQQQYLDAKAVDVTLS